MEKRRGRREIEVTRRRGGVKRGERNLASNQSPIVLHSLEHSERFTEFHREEKREIEVTRRRGGGVQMRATNLACDQFPKCSPQPGIPKEIHRVK